MPYGCIMAGDVMKNAPWKKEEIEELVENLYNKEKFRSQEYAKHLSLFKKNR